MTEKDIDRLLRNMSIEDDDFSSLDDESSYSDIVSQMGINPSVLRVLDSSSSLEDHERLCHELEKLELYSENRLAHPYLNAPMSKYRELYDSINISSNRPLSMATMKQLEEKIITETREEQELEEPIHSKFYMIGAKNLYERYGIVADDDIAEKVIAAIVEQDNYTLDKLNRGQTRKYVEIFVELTDSVRLGLEYSTNERRDLIEKNKQISERLGLRADEELGDLFKATYILNDWLNSLEDTLDHFQTSEIFNDFIGRALTQAETRFIINLLFDKPKANKFEFLNDSELHETMLEDNERNRNMLADAILGLANNFRYLEDETLSFEEGYANMFDKFDKKITILSGNFKLDIARAVNGELLVELREFLESKKIIESFCDWNNVSVCSYILRHMMAQTQLPEYYGSEDRIREIDSEIERRLSSNVETQMIEVKTNDNNRVYLSKIRHNGHTNPVVLEFGQPKTKYSAVEKILRGSDRVDDTFRCRVGIPYEIEIAQDNAQLKQFCLGMTHVLVKKLGASLVKIRKVKTSLLNDEPHLNKFSKNIRTFKYIVDLDVDGETVPLEIMMILFYPEDHSSYKARQCENTRNKLGLLPAEAEIKKAIEYLSWKYAFEGEISEIDILRFNSIVATIVNEDSEVVLEDQSVCDALKNLCRKFSNKFMEEQYQTAIIREILLNSALNERKRLIEEIDEMKNMYIETSCEFEPGHIETVLSIHNSTALYNVNLSVQDRTDLETFACVLSIHSRIDSRDKRVRLFDLLDLVVGGKESQSQ